MNVITAKGKEFLSDYFVEHQPSRSIYFRVQETSLETARLVFSDPEETARIRYGKDCFDGFTILDFAMDEGNGIKVRLIHG